jgi:subfamily B ATP-binding cassette protein MsbA
MNLYRRLLELVKPHWHRLAIAMVCMVGVAICTAALPYLVKPVLDDIFIKKNAETLKFLSIVVFLVFTIKALTEWGHAYLMSYVGQTLFPFSTECPQGS